MYICVEVLMYKRIILFYYVKVTVSTLVWCFSIINNVESVITITPIGDAPTYVNGNLISEPVTLQHVSL